MESAVRKLLKAVADKLGEEEANALADVLKGCVPIDKSRWQLVPTTTKVVVVTKTVIVVVTWILKSKMTK